MNCISLFLLQQPTAGMKHNATVLYPLPFRSVCTQHPYVKVYFLCTCGGRKHLNRFTSVWNSGSLLFEGFPTVIKNQPQKGARSVRLQLILLLNIKQLERVFEWLRSIQGVDHDSRVETIRRCVTASAHRSPVRVLEYDYRQQSSKPAVMVSWWLLKTENTATELYSVCYSTKSSLLAARHCTIGP